MSISEYGIGVQNDFFIANGQGSLAFPCCSCKHKDNGPTSHPCNICGHNDTAMETYDCTLCGEMQIGNIHTNGKVIGHGTPARIYGVCPTCYETIKDEIVRVDNEN